MSFDAERSGTPLVSVVVPVFNGERALARCLEALLSQTLPCDDYEIIVVDDGSVDGTSVIAQRYPVRYVHQHNQGPAKARNHGATLAEAEILLFTDSDCVPAENWISEMLSSFSDPDVVAAKGAYQCEQREVVARFVQIEFEQRYSMLEKVDSIDMIDTYSAGYRRDIFHEMGGFDTRFPKADNEDTELSYRLASRDFKMVFNPNAIVVHLGHPGSLVRYARLKFSRGYWRMVVYKRYPEKMIKDTYTPQTLKLQILSLFVLFLSIPVYLAAPILSLTLVVVSITFFLILSLPFLRLALQKDPLVALISPALLAVRAMALGAGALWGTIFGRLGEVEGG